MSSCVIYGSTEFTNLFFTGEGRGGDFVESNKHVENGIKVMILSQNLTTNLNCYRRNKLAKLANFVNLLGHPFKPQVIANEGEWVWHSRICCM